MHQRLREIQKKLYILSRKEDKDTINIDEPIKDYNTYIEYIDILKKIINVSNKKLSNVVSLEQYPGTIKLQNTISRLLFYLNEKGVDFFNKETGTDYTLIDVLNELNGYIANHTCTIREFLCNYSQCIISHALCDIILHLSKGTSISIIDIIHEYLDIDNNESILSLALKVMANSGFISPDIINLFHSDTIYSLALRTFIDILNSDLPKLIDNSDPIIKGILVLLDLLCKSIRIWLEKYIDNTVTTTTTTNKPLLSYKNFIDNKTIDDVYISLDNIIYSYSFTCNLKSCKRFIAYCDTEAGYTACKRKLQYSLPRDTIDRNSNLKDNLIITLFYVLESLLYMKVQDIHKTIQYCIDTLDTLCDEDPILLHIISIYWLQLLNKQQHYSDKDNNLSGYLVYKEYSHITILLLQQLGSSVDTIYTYIYKKLSKNNTKDIIHTLQDTGCNIPNEIFNNTIKQLISSIAMIKSLIIRTDNLLIDSNNLELSQEYIDARFSIISVLAILQSTLFNDYTNKYLNVHQACVDKHFEIIFTKNDMVHIYNLFKQEYSYKNIDTCNYDEFNIYIYDIHLIEALNLINSRYIADIMNKQACWFTKLMKNYCLYPIDSKNKIHEQFYILFCLEILTKINYENNKEKENIYDLPHLQYLKNSSNNIISLLNDTTIIEENKRYLSTICVALQLQLQSDTQQDDISLITNILTIDLNANNKSSDTTLIAISLQLTHLCIKYLIKYFSENSTSIQRLWETKNFLTIMYNIFTGSWLPPSSTGYIQLSTNFDLNDTITPHTLFSYIYMNICKSLPIYNDNNSYKKCFNPILKLVSPMIIQLLPSLQISLLEFQNKSITNLNIDKLAPIKLFINDPFIITTLYTFLSSFCKVTHIKHETEKTILSLFNVDHDIVSLYKTIVIPDINDAMVNQIIKQITMSDDTNDIKKKSLHTMLLTKVGTKLQNILPSNINNKTITFYTLKDIATISFIDYILNNCIDFNVKEKLQSILNLNNDDRNIKDVINTIIYDLQNDKNCNIDSRDELELM